MIYRRIDEDGDYVFGHGKQAYLTGVDAVAQAIKTRLYLLYGEWWEDREDGLPLWERILASSGSQANQQAVDYIIKDRIQDTEGVLALQGYRSEYDHQTRKYTFTAAVETIYGTLVLSNGGMA